MIRRIFRGLPRTGDRYGSFTDLARREREGRDFRRVLLDRGSAIAIIAPHGGGIEPGTSEVAAALAGEEFSLYSFEGIKPRGNEHLHVTSPRFDDPICLGLIGRSRTVVTVHGCSGEDRGIRLGGLDTDLKSALIRSLTTAGFIPLDDDAIFTGSDPGNICNRGSSGRGVQMELSRGLRGVMFLGLARDERDASTPLFRRFVLAVRATLLAAIPAPAERGPLV